MRGEGVSTLVALCVVSVGADVTVETTAPPPTTPDVDAQWLEGFRRQLLREDHTYGPAPARAPAGGPGTTPGRGAPGRPPDARRDGALPRDQHGDDSQAQGAQSSDDAAASRENGISRRDLREPSGEASLAEEELDLSRKAFLDNLYELEEQLKPVYVSSKKGTGDGNVPIQSRKKNEQDVEESPPYIEQNGVRRYKVNMDRKQRIRNQLDDGLTWLQDVIITRELSTEDNQHENEENEDPQQSEKDNEDGTYNQGRPQYEQNESRGQENEQEREESASRPEEESGENGEQTQELVASEYKQENVRSLYVGGRPAGGEEGE